MVVINDHHGHQKTWPKLRTSNLINLRGMKSYGFAQRAQIQPTVLVVNLCEECELRMRAEDANSKK